MESRRLGKADHRSTVVTYGAAALAGVDQDTADRALTEALALGINHVDVAPSYGEAELRLSSYLKRHPQPKLFISCKTAERSKAGARAELDRTLDRLHRDHFDLYQLHAVCNTADLDACFAPGGSMEAILEARDEGLVTHIGITGHGPQSPATHAAALDRFPFSTVMTSSNVFLCAKPDFRRDWDALVARCQKDDVGIHVLKAAAKAAWDDRTPTFTTWYEPFVDQTDVDRAVAWVLNQPVTTMCSPSDVRLLAGFVSAAERYRGVADQTALTLLADPAYGNIFVTA